MSMLTLSIPANCSGVRLKYQRFSTAFVRPIPTYRTLPAFASETTVTYLCRLRKEVSSTQMCGIISVCLRRSPRSTACSMILEITFHPTPSCRDTADTLASLSHPITISSKSKVCRELDDAQGTCTVRTPHARHFTRGTRAINSVR